MQKHRDQEIVSNSSAVTEIEYLLSTEFVCYGYRINRKKVRRLMKKNRLLNYSYNRREKAMVR